MQPVHLQTNHGNESDSGIPDTKVLAIASHVTYGYVGNTMATFVMQSLGCEVAAINTVHFSNHTGYGQFKGTRTPASEITDLYEGLKASYLTDFDVLLSGYIPSAESLEAVGDIARDLRRSSKTKPGGFFWVLDPVMGDQGKLYVSEELVAGYKSLIREADLVVPNQFEASVLTGIDLEEATLENVAKAVEVLHKEYGLKHVIVTSVRVKSKESLLCVVGSSARSNGDSRLFVIEIPVLDCFFSGTGDMFAALLVGRLRQACQSDGALDRNGWTSEDTVASTDLPLAKATCKVLSSMHMVLEKTMVARNQEMDRWEGSVIGVGDDVSRRRYLTMTKAAEVKVVQNVKDLIQPRDRYTASAVYF